MIQLNQSICLVSLNVTFSLRILQRSSGTVSVSVSSTGGRRLPANHAVLISTALHSDGSKVRSSNTGSQCLPYGYWTIGKHTFYHACSKNKDDNFTFVCHLLISPVLYSY